MLRTYWNNAGKYEKEYVLLTRTLVPSEGHAETWRGEVLRCMANLYHTYYNDGAGWSDNVYAQNVVTEWAYDNAEPTLWMKTKALLTAHISPEWYENILNAIIEWLLATEYTDFVI